jgi:hypothetical protein
MLIHPLKQTLSKTQSLKYDEHKIKIEIGVIIIVIIISNLIVKSLKVIIIS